MREDTMNNLNNIHYWHRVFSYNWKLLNDIDVHVYYLLQN